MVNKMTEESILKSGEREMREIAGYVQLLLDSLNDLITKYKDELKNMGILNKLLIDMEIITMHKYNPEVYITSGYWDDLVNIINLMKQNNKISNDLSDIIKLLEEINELKAKL